MISVLSYLNLLLYIYFIIVYEKFNVLMLYIPVHRRPSMTMAIYR